MQRVQGTLNYLWVNHSYVVHLGNKVTHGMASQKESPCDCLLNAFGIVSNCTKCTYNNMLYGKYNVSNAPILPEVTTGITTYINEQEWFSRNHNNGNGN